MKKIRLPRVSGYRALAKHLVDSEHINIDDVVEIDGRHVVASSPSFVAELVSTVAESHPQEVILVGANKDLVRDFKKATAKTNLKTKFVTMSEPGQLV